MRLLLDRPFDGWLLGRAEPIVGRLVGRRDGALAAWCGSRPVLLRPCLHPDALAQAEVRGFWGMVFVQEVGDAVHHGRLRIELTIDGRPAGALVLRVAPSALQLAREHPLDLGLYEVPPLAPSAAPLPEVVVFPGLGAVGGASLNETLRVQMLREGGDVTVHSEADCDELWRLVCERGAPPYRWIDGHRCYDSATVLGRSFARVTLLREPIRRLVSVFDYGTLVHPDRFRFADLDDFVASGAAAQYTQAASLLRCAGIPQPTELPPDELLARAQDELSRAYRLVGITERFEESLLLLGQLAGLSAIGMWWRVLSAPRSVPVEELSARTRARIERLVEADRVLYERASRALDERLAGAGLEAAIDRYRDAAARTRELDPVAKLLECLRWRQVLESTAWHRNSPEGTDAPP